MANVPDEVLSVPRPSDTVVINTGSKFLKQFCVREKLSPEERADNSSTKYGRVIGHIYDGTFHPVEKKEAGTTSYMVSYGTAAFTLSESREIYDMLNDALPPNLASQTYALAVMRFLYPHAATQTLSSRYKASYLSVVMPQVDLSRNNISELYETLGKNNEGREKFHKNLLDRLGEYSVLYID